jgi:uncharacterized protein YoxC
MRKIDSENGALIRENQTLSKNIELFKKNTEELMNENNQLKDSLDELEVSNSDKELEIQQLRNSNSMLNAEVQRVKRNRTMSRERKREEMSSEKSQRDLNISHIPDSSPIEKDHHLPQRRPVDLKSLYQSIKNPKSSFKSENSKNLYQEYLNRISFSSKPQSNSHSLLDQSSEPSQVYNKQSVEEEYFPKRSKLQKYYEEYEQANSRQFNYLTPEKDKTDVPTTRASGGGMGNYL